MAALIFAGFALAMLSLSARFLRNGRINCLVVGGECSDGLSDAHLRWGAGPHHAINIVPLAYEQLYKRACKLSEPFRNRLFENLSIAVPATQPMDCESQEADMAAPEEDVQSAA